MKNKENRGNQLKQEKENKKKINKKKIVVLAIVILFILFLALIVVFILSNKLHKFKSEEDITSYLNQINEVEISEERKEKEPEIVDAQMPDKMGKYNVIGQLVIEKISLDKYILHTTDEASLKLSITRYYGPQPNKKGNFCIVGHNSKKQFTKLKRLSIDDTFYIIDKETCEKVTYRIYDIYTVKPSNLACLNQNTNDRREVTLITCNPRRIN